MYTFKHKVKGYNSSAVKALKSAMKGVNGVSVEHLGDNKYKIHFLRETDTELRNLAQMGEFTKYMVKFKNPSWEL